MNEFWLSWLRKRQRRHRQSPKGAAASKPLSGEATPAADTHLDDDGASAAPGLWADPGNWVSFPESGQPLAESGGVIHFGPNASPETTRG
jgi:hypothetical protein